MKPTIKIEQNIEKDAWNWWDACNKTSHGVDWKIKIDADLREKITGKTWDEAYIFLKPHLDKLHTELNISEYVKNIQRDFDQNKDALFARMEEVTGHPICRQDFTCFPTTFPRFPYNYDKGYVWISSRQPIGFQLSVFIHELLHFQYFAYFGEKVWDTLEEKGHATLKEAMTVIINDEFKNLTSEEDEGYEIHQELRPQLLTLWRSDKNMDRFIDSAIKLMNKK